MKDILTDLYNKVINFFQAEKIESENTKETAKSRLRLVLMQDRSNLEPETMAQLREELIEVISKYIVIDKEALGLNLDGDGESMALMLNIPVIRAKKPEEIREALEAAKNKAEEIKEIEVETEDSTVVEEEREQENIEIVEETEATDEATDAEEVSETEEVAEDSIIVEVETEETVDSEVKEEEPSVETKKKKSNNQ